MRGGPGRRRPHRRRRRHPPTRRTYRRLGHGDRVSWLAAGIRRIPSWSKDTAGIQPTGPLPRQLPSHPSGRRHAQGRHRFPGSEFLQALDDLDTGATFDFAVNLVTLSREMEFVRNDRAKGNIDDQFTQRRDVATATPN